MITVRTAYLLRLLTWCNSESHSHANGGWWVWPAMPAGSQHATSYALARHPLVRVRPRSTGRGGQLCAGADASISNSFNLMRLQRWNHAIRTNNEKDPRFLPFAGFLPVGPAPTGTCRVQVLRSAGEWSAGLPTTEDSIYKCMIDLVTKSKCVSHSSYVHACSHCHQALHFYRESVLYLVHTTPKSAPA